MIIMTSYIIKQFNILIEYVNHVDLDVKTVQAIQAVHNA